MTEYDDAATTIMRMGVHATDGPGEEDASGCPGLPWGLVGWLVGWFGVQATRSEALVRKSGRKKIKRGKFFLWLVCW